MELFARVRLIFQCQVFTVVFTIVNTTVVGLCNDSVRSPLDIFAKWREFYERNMIGGSFGNNEIAKVISVLFLVKELSDFFPSTRQCQLHILHE